jgi:hypothetical protein
VSHPQKQAVRNASDEAQVRRAGDRAKSARERYLDDLKLLLGHPQGRNVLWMVLGTCGVFRSVMAPSEQIHYLEGRRSVGLELIADIEDADPKGLIRLMDSCKTEEERHG